MLKWIFLIALIANILIISMFIVEERIERLPPESKLKKWWRKHLIGEDIYGDGF